MLQYSFECLSICCDISYVRPLPNSGACFCCMLRSGCLALASLRLKPAHFVLLELQNHSMNTSRQPRVSKRDVPSRHLAQHSKKPPKPRQGHQNSGQVFPSRSKDTTGQQQFHVVILSPRVSRAGLTSVGPTCVPLPVARLASKSECASARSKCAALAVRNL